MWGLVPLGGAVVVIVAWALALMLIDEKSRRLPNHFTIPAAIGSVTGALINDPVLILGGVAWAGLYLLLGLISGGIGGGDIKLGVSLGILVVAAGGIVGWFIAVLAASMFTVLRALITSRRDIPHGPSMIIASALCLLLVLS